MVSIRSRSIFPVIAVLLIGGALFLAGCTARFKLLAGSIVSGGDDVIRVQMEEVNSSPQAMDKVVRTLDQSPFRVQMLDRRSGYVQTKKARLSDSLTIRLSLWITDSLTVEIAGKHRDPRQGLGADAWRRITWNEPPIHDGWDLMVDLATTLGSVTEFERDPAFGKECGGRTCSRNAICWRHVCLQEPPDAFAATSSQPPSADEHFQAGQTRPDASRDIFRLTNRERQKRGRSPLAWDSTLAQIACWHNQDMLTHGYLGHKDGDGLRPRDRVAREHRRLLGLVGENVASQGALSRQADSVRKRRWAKTFVNWWMDSPGHRANILRTRFSHTGTCATHDSIEGRATQVFADVQAYLDRPVPWSVSSGDSLRVSIVPVKVKGPPWKYEFVPNGEPLGEAFTGEQPLFDGMLRFPASPGEYGSRFLLPNGEDRYSIVRGPQVLVED